MTMSINKLAVSESSSFYYSREIKTLLESHVGLLIKSDETSLMELLPSIVYKYEGDLYGLLTVLKIPLQYHWIIMRMNGYSSPNQLPHNKYALLRPSFAMIDQIINMYRSSKSIKR